MTNKIIAFDPGGTTGYAIYTNGRFHSEQLPETEHHLGLWNLLRIVKPDVLVCEEFDRRSNVAANLISKEYIGVIKLYGALNDLPVAMQSASFGKAFFTNDKLKALDLKAKKMPHADDSMRHLLAYMLKHKLLSQQVLSTLHSLALDQSS